MAVKTILVVDCDDVFRVSLVDVLNDAEYKAFGAPEGSHAITIGITWNKWDRSLVLEMAQLDMTGVELIHALASQQRTMIRVIASSSLFSQADMDIQLSFRSNAGIRKAATAMPAVASKWLLITRSLLGELAEPVLAPSSSNILVADDDPNVRHFLKVILNREGYQVLEAADNADLDKPEDGFAFVAKPFLPNSVESR